MEGAGLRRAEVVGCRWCDFDVVRGRLRVFRKGQNWYWLPLAPDVVEELRASFRELEPDLEDFMFTVEVEQWVSQHERVRRVKDPKAPASAQALWRMVRRVCKRAGVRELSPHQLRHGFANRFLRTSSRRDVAALRPLLPAFADRHDAAVHGRDRAGCTRRSARPGTSGESRTSVARIWRHLRRMLLLRCNRWSGGGGNRTRVRGRTDVSVYKLRSPLNFALRPVCDRPTVELALLWCRAFGRVALPWRQAC